MEYEDLLRYFLEEVCEEYRQSVKDLLSAYENALLSEDVQDYPDIYPVIDEFSEHFTSALAIILDDKIDFVLTNPLLLTA